MRGAVLLLEEPREPRTGGTAGAADWRSRGEAAGRRRTPGSRERGEGPRPWERGAQAAWAIGRGGNLPAATSCWSQPGTVSGGRVPRGRMEGRPWAGSEEGEGGESARASVVTERTEPALLPGRRNGGAGEWGGTRPLAEETALRFLAGNLLRRYLGSDSRGVYRPNSYS